LATGTTGRATGTGVLFTGIASFLTAGAGFCACAIPTESSAAANKGTKSFVMIFLLLRRRYKN
jgi:hypothetical protein